MKKKTQISKKHIRTVIPELSKMINSSTYAVTTYRHSQALLDFEDYIYRLEESKVRSECIAELKKAKQIMRTRKGWRWEVIKQTKFHPVKLLLLFMAWFKNRKHGNGN